MQNLKDYIKNDYKSYPLEFILEAIAIPAAITGSLLFAVYLEDVNWILAYCCFVSASAVLLFTSYRRGAIMWVVMNAVYLFINAVGLVKSII